MRARDLSSLSLAACLALLALGCAEQPTGLLGGDTTTSGPGGPSSSSGGDGGSTGEGGNASTTSTSSGQGGGGVEATFELTLDDAAPELELRDEVELEVTIAENGYVGNVFLAVTGLPGDVDAVLGGASVSLDGTGTETVTLTLTTASSTVTGDFDFTVTATSEDGNKMVAGALAVIPTLTVMIPADLASFTGSDDAFGDYPTMVTALPAMSADNPITVLFYNADSVAHEMHADDGASGFGHGNADIPPGDFDPVVREVSAPGTYDFYPHDLNDTTIRGQIVIQ